MWSQSNLLRPVAEITIQELDRSLRKPISYCLRLVFYELFLLGAPNNQLLIITYFVPRFCHGPKSLWADFVFEPKNVHSPVDVPKYSKVE